MSHRRINKMVLGTAQLGMDYGIANVRGQPDEKLACEIVKTALGCDVNCFDTAQAYGNSEVVLGKALKCCGSDPDIKIVSKLSPDLQPTDSESVKQSVETSCQNLGVEQLWCLMLHRANWLDFWDEGLGLALSDVVRRGFVKYLGVSTYYPGEARRALENSDIQVIQVPCNAWDQRMKTAGVFELARSLNKLCFVRSIYLQGLFLMSPSQVAEKLPRAADVSRKWFELAETMESTPKELAFRFALSLNCPLVVGAETLKQVEENIRLSQRKPLSKGQIEQIRRTIAPLVDAQITNPCLWHK